MQRYLWQPHFLVSVFDTLTSWSLLTLGGTAPFRVSHFLEIIKESSANLPFTFKSTNPEPIPEPPPLSVFLIPGLYSLVLITPGPGPIQQKTTIIPQSLMKLFKLANPKPAYPACPIPSYGNHHKCTSLYFLPLSPDCTCVAPPLEIINIALYF